MSGTLCFFHSTDNEQHYLICYDSQVDQIINQIKIDSPLKDMIVFKADSAVKDPVYYLTVIDQTGQLLETFFVQQSQPLSRLLEDVRLQKPTVLSPVHTI